MPSALLAFPRARCIENVTLLSRCCSNSFTIFENLLRPVRSHQKNVKLANFIVYFLGVYIKNVYLLF